ncbi:MAG: FkbM family methyltransferase [Nitrososphaeraceae archaeon]|nr:FkbM family methyltransferase [Nitrososphaeraceae archaeon]
MLNEPEGVLPVLDKCILFFLKIVYLGLRILLRLVLGKKRRDRLYTERGINHVWIDYLNPSLGLLKLFYKSIKFLGAWKSPVLIKISVPKYGYKFYCRINKADFMTREDGIIEHFTPKQGDIVIDIGAHMGRYTIIGAKRVGAQGKVVAIEAHPGNFEMLNRNIKLNQLTNVIPLNYAAYSKETKIRLYVPGEESGYTVYNTIMSNRAGTEENFVEVNANTLDYLLQLNQIRQEQVKWIKIDVEGAELDVLKGSTNVLSKSKDIALLIEVHGPANYRPVVEFLSLYNFKIEFEKSHDSGDKHIIAQKQP